MSLFLRESAYGVSAIVLPAYRFRAGLGSKLSRWLVPPIMNSQITFLALGGKMGPVRRAPGGRLRRIGSRDPVAVQHRAQGQSGETHAHICQECSSARHGRVTHNVERFISCSQIGKHSSGSPDRHEIVVVQQHVNEILAGSMRRIGRGRNSRRVARL